MFALVPDGRQVICSQPDFGDALHCPLEVGFVGLETKEVLAAFFRGHGGCSASHVRVKHGLEIVPAKNLLDELYGFLCWVAVVARTTKGENAPWARLSEFVFAACIEISHFVIADVFVSAIPSSASA